MAQFCKFLLLLPLILLLVVLGPHAAYAITERGPANPLMGGEWLSGMPSGGEFRPGGNQPVLEVNYKRGCKPNVDVVEYLYAEIQAASLRTGTDTNQAMRDWVREIGKAGDQAGHIVGKNQGGLGTVKWNIFPQSANINMGVYASQVERLVNQAAERSGVVQMWFRFVYDDANYPCRPSKFDYYLIANREVAISNDLVNP